MKHGKSYYKDVKKLKDNREKLNQFRAKGMPLRDMLKQLGITSANYYRIIKEYPELAEYVEDGKKELVYKLKNELINRCFKHTLTTTKTYKKKDTETGNETVFVEKVEKEVDGDIVAIQILLKNNEEGWTDNPAELELRKQEFEWKKKIDREELGLKEEEVRKKGDEGWHIV